MNGLTLPIGLAASLLLALSARAADDGLPVVAEHYDAVYLVHEDAQERDWNVTRVYFVREGKIIADRAVHDEMHWSTTADGKMLICWDDYGQCHRRITFDKLIELPDFRPPATAAGEGAWWCMGRRMTDLKAP